MSGRIPRGPKRLQRQRVTGALGLSYRLKIRSRETVPCKVSGARKPGRPSSECVSRKLHLP